MLDHLKASLTIFRQTDDILPRLFEGLDRNQLLHRTGPTSNPLIWMFGHLAVMRFRIGNVLGKPESVPMEALFGARSKVEDLLCYPSIEEIRGYQGYATTRLYSRIDAATVEIATRPTPNSDRPTAEMVNFAGYHEAMLIGQIVFLRKVVGVDSSDPLLD